MRTQTPGPQTVGFWRGQIQKSQGFEYEIFQTKSAHRVIVRSRARSANALFEQRNRIVGERQSQAYEVADRPIGLPH